MYPENKKAALVAEAINNQRKLNDQQKENLEEKAISEAYINMYPNTELTEQSLSETLTGDRENTDLYSTIKDAGGDLIYGLSGLDVELGNAKLQEMRNDATDENLNQGEVTLDELRLQYPYLNETQLNNLLSFKN